MQGYPGKGGQLSKNNDSISSDSYPAVKRSLALAQQHQAGIPLAGPSAPSVKVPRVDTPVTPSPFSVSRRTLERSASMESHRGQFSSRGRSSNSGYRHGPSQPSRLSGQQRRGPKAFAGKSNNKLELDPPFHNEAYITEAHQKSQAPPQSKYTAAPKSSLGNICRDVLKVVAPQYVAQNGIIQHGNHRSLIWRSTVTIQGDGVDPIVATGDATDKKESERLAALSALYQMNNLDLLNVKKPRVDAKPNKQEIYLSDGSAINYERARSFMDYYCRRYKFGRVDVILKQLTNQNKWEAVMSVNESRIGVGTATSKKLAQIQCYLDVTQYLESCDPALWKDFVEAAKSGADLGLAPRVRFQISTPLDDTIQDLCMDIRTSTLYRNRPSRSGLQQSVNPLLDLRPSSRNIMQGRGLPHKSQALSSRREQYLSNPKMEAMRNTRKALPVYSRSKEILDHVRRNDVTICMATTGSGKTTQVPQVILDDYIERGVGAECNIVCTQPRRLATMSVADRVAKERGEILGASIGYQVRFENQLPQPHGSVTFCTTGVFLKRLQSALSGTDDLGRRDMDDITHIVVDEVHERDVDTDLLLVVLKRLMHDRRSRNKPLKIVLMSATVDPTLFQSYFKDELGRPCKVIDIPGRTFPVEKHFMDDFLPKIATGPTRWVFDQEPVAKYIHKQLGDLAANKLGVRLAKPLSESDEELELPYPLIAATISHVLRSSNDGHVLVFLPGWDEITKTQRALEQPSGPLPINVNDHSKYSVHLLHSSIPLRDQQVIFEPPPPGIRRIILATNIAETSVTIPDVVYVVDTAKIKENRYEPERHMSTLVSTWVGTSNLNQRAGRAGRHRSGEYYGILSKRCVATLHPHQPVEMKRVDLSNVVMHVKALNFPGMTVEEVLAATMEPPEVERVSAALKSLHMVGALDPDQNLTQLGRVLLALPVDAQMGRMVLYGSFFRCLDQALALAAILSNRDPFVAPMHMRREAEAVKNSWAPQGFRSDALATLRAFNEWWSMQSRGHYVVANKFCFDNYLAKPTLLLIQKVKQQLLQSLDRAGVLKVSAGGRARLLDQTSTPAELNVNGECWPLLSGLLAVACQPKFAIRTGEMTLRTATDKMTFIHPGSVNNRKREMKLNSSGAAPEGKQIYAYVDKRRNTTQQSGQPQTLLVSTSRLDLLVYLLFGAYKMQIVDQGLECDNWLPVVGDIDTLDSIQQLKYYMESCFLRIFEGIVAGRRRGQVVSREEEDEDEYEDIDKRDYSLSRQELQELDDMTQRIVHVLNRYNEERMETQSQSNSRSSTPLSSPWKFAARLPGGSRSGYSTPYAFQSRPGTPSNLSSWIS